MNENNITKSKKNKKVITISISIMLGLVLLLLGIAFAVWFITRAQQSTNIVKALDCLDISLSGNEAIDLNGAFPLTNQEGMDLIPHSFKIINECDIYVSVNIYLAVLNKTDMESEYVRVSLQEKDNTDDNSNILSSYNITTPTVLENSTSYNLESEILLSPNQTIEKDLRVWMNESTLFEEVKGKEFYSKIVISARPIGEMTLTFKNCQSEGITNLGECLIAANGGPGINLLASPNFDSLAGTNYDIVRKPADYLNDNTSIDGWTCGISFAFDENTKTFAIEGLEDVLEFDITVGGILQNIFTWNLFCSSNNITENLKRIYFISDYDYTYLEFVPVLNPRGLYSATDDDGTSYYFRGTHEAVNNNVIFAGFQWKIVRIDGNGNIRMIYNGTEAQFNTNKKVNGNDAGADPNIQNSAFNSQWNHNRFVGYMYGTATGTFEQQHANTNNSTIKGVVDTWLTNNITGESRGKLVNIPFCNDRSIANSTILNESKRYLGWVTIGGAMNGLGTNQTVYGSIARNLIEDNPSLHCSQVNDRLSLPIGLITVDEVIKSGSSNFLGNESATPIFNTSQSYWTMSPGRFSHAYATVYSSSYWGAVEGVFGRVDMPLGVRPVIAINKNISIISGDGSSENPFRI